jgi:FtsZ-interacting cell division protein ZipA
MNNLPIVVLVLALIALVVGVIWRLLTRVSTRTKNPLDENAVKRADIESAIKEAHDVVAAYGEVLERTNEPGVIFHSQADLPHTKAEIRKCIEMLLLLPNDDTRLNNLEAADIYLDNFIPDEEYRIVHPQRAGLSQALKSYAASERDAMQICKTATDGVTQEGEAHHRQVEERIRRENLLTLERHQAIAANRSRLAALGVK